MVPCALKFFRLYFWNLKIVCNPIKFFAAGYIFRIIKIYAFENVGFSALYRFKKIHRKGRHFLLANHNKKLQRFWQEMLTAGAGKEHGFDPASLKAAHPAYGIPQSPMTVWPISICRIFLRYLRIWWLSSEETFLAVCCGICWSRTAIFLTVSGHDIRNLVGSADFCRGSFTGANSFYHALTFAL